MKDKFLDRNGKISTSKIRSADPKDIEILKSKNPNLSSDSIPEHLYWIEHNLFAYPKSCLECDNPVTRFHSFNKGYTAEYCSASCARKSAVADRKKKQTIKDRYGVESIWQVPKILNKRHQTCLEKYGEANSMRLARNAVYEKYGVSHVSEVPGVLDRRLETIKHREISKLSNNNPNFSIVNDTYEGHKDYVEFECKRCSGRFSSKPLKISCPVCDKSGARSVIESILLANVKTYAPNVLFILNKKLNDLNIYPDIFCPENNLAVEIDGNYWHAEGRGGDKLKSYRKKKLYRQHGISSLFFFEDECYNKSEIVASIICAKLNIFKNKIRASQCEVRDVALSEAAHFLNENHLQGNVRASFRFGLFLKDELVAIATFGKSRFNKKANIELLRLCFKKHTKIHGGSAKLMQYAKTFFNGPIVSYSDNRFSEGDVYRALGFEHVSSNSPSYFYMHKSNYLVRMSRMKFQKHKLVANGGSSLLTEWENAQLAGLDRIFDCGSNTWILE